MGNVTPKQHRNIPMYRYQPLTPIILTMFLIMLQNDVHVTHISIVPPTALFTLVLHITCHTHDSYISLPLKNIK